MRGLVLLGASQASGSSAAPEPRRGRAPETAGVRAALELATPETAQTRRQEPCV